VDIARLAGLYPAGVICEIMNDDGTMARLPDLVQFAQLHGLKLGTIADLIAYRRRKDTLVTAIHEDVFTLANGSEMKAHVYLNTVTNEEHIALVKGDISGPEPVLTRFHAENLVADIAGSGMPRAGVFEKSLNAIDKEGRGVVVIIRNTSPTPFTDSMRPESSGDPMPTRLLDYGVGAQIATDLGLHEIELLSNTPRTVVALEGYDLKIVGQRPISE
jgi:3,4-dihydroxy 2-butanone 4-phosphate synthase/GTP cyclohydrolase II